MVHIFIINAYAGNDNFSAGLRNHLSKRTDITYYIFHSRSRENETEIAREVINLFEGEDIRIYSCGGSGTFRNILAGIDDLSKVELAFYPKGLTNDFLKVFGEKEKYFKDIDNLIDGIVTPIDYINTNHGKALNTFSLGLDTIQVSKSDFYRPMMVFGKRTPYFLGYIAALFRFSPYDVEIEFDGKKRTGRFTEVFLGNGCVIGGTLWMDECADIADGLGRLVLFKCDRAIQRLTGLLTCAKKDISSIQKYGTVGYTSGLAIRRRDGVPLVVDFDGELQPAQREWKVEIVQKGLKFVIPKGVLSDE